MTTLQWSSELPAGWKVEQARRVLRRVKRPVRPDDRTVTAFRDGEVTLRSNRRTEGFTEAFAEVGYHGVRAGDLAVHAMDGFAGAIGVSDSDGKVSPVVHLYNVGLGDARFFAYALREAARAGFVTSLAKGIRERSTSFDPQTLAAMDLPVPEPHTQRRIADYLDRETATIDALIEKQRGLVALLEQRRAAAVEACVVRGLYPDAVMDESTIPWLGGAAIPAHWMTAPMNALVGFSAGKNITSEEIELEGRFPVYGGNGLRGFADGWTHAGERLLVGRQGALCGNVHHVRGRHWASEHALVSEARSEFQLRWLMYVLQVMNLGQYSAASAQPGIAAGTILKLRLPVPPLNEQREIADHLDRETAKIDALITKAERFIELAQERRAALITAAVTGQIEIPT